MFKRQIEFERDHRAAIGAGGRHLLQSGHLAELALERRGDGRRHHIRTRARIERDDLDGRIIHFRQRGHGQLLVGHAAHQQNPGHQQRSGDGPENKCPRRVHEATIHDADLTRPPRPLLSVLRPPVMPAAALPAGRLLAGNLRVHLAAFFQPIHAHGDHRIARLQAGVISDWSPSVVPP